MRDEDLNGGVRVHAVAGTHAVLLGFDIEGPPRNDFLGFAVDKTVLPDGDPEPLPNFIRFTANDRPDGPFDTFENPLQAFQWGDYGVEPGQQLRYRVHAVHGSPGNPVLSNPPAEVRVTAEPADDGRHGIYFNRGVAGSQAYARRFGSTSPLGVPEARRWLSRGLEEGLLGFIERAAGPGQALRGAMYEFVHAPVLEALRAAAVRGADVALVVSCPSDSGDWPDHPGPANADAMRKLDPIRRRHPFIRIAKARRNTNGAIAHNKFLVLLEQGVPQAVWTGSTNITPGAMYGHSNLGHIVTDPAVAGQFMNFWTELHEDHAPPVTEQWVEDNSPLFDVGPAAPAVPHGTSTLFSPRSSTTALDRYIDLIRGARQSVFLSAPFGVSAPFEPELRTARGTTRYVMMDKPGNDMELRRADPSLNITAGAFLGKGDFRQFMEEHLTGLNVHVRFIHTKYLLVDALTDDPLLVTGSANFSPASTTDNDENMLVISGDRRVADIYLTEFMRLFTHLRFRAAVGARRPDQPAPGPGEPDVRSPKHLDGDSGWAAEYLVPGSPKARERLLFSGQLSQ